MSGGDRVALCTVVHALIISLVLLGTAEVDAESESQPWEAPPLLNAEGMLTSSAVIEPPLSSSDHHLFGVGVDVGVPDGAAVSLVINPISWLRFSLAGLTYGAAAGMRVSVALVPFHGTFRPTLSFDGGHYFPGDLASVFGIGGAAAGPLSRVQYDFGSAHLGFEVGSGRLSFIFRAGASYLDGTLGPVSTEGSTSGSVHVRSLMPSLKLGVLLCFG